MSRLLIAICLIALSTGIQAQKKPSLSKEDLNVTKTNVLSSEKTEMHSQISDALLRDDDLQSKAVNYLKNNKATKGAMMELFKQDKIDSKSLMNSILSDESLSTTLMDWVMGDSKMLEQVRSITGK